MLTTILFIAKITLVLSLGICLFRILRGPSLMDRVLALDSVAVHIVALLLIITIELGTKLYLDAALIITLVGFLATISLAKFLMKGKIIE